LQDGQLQCRVQNRHFSHQRLVHDRIDYLLSTCEKTRPKGQPFGFLRASRLEYNSSCEKPISGHGPVLGTLQHFLPKFIAAQAPPAPQRAKGLGIRWLKTKKFHSSFKLLAPDSGILLDAAEQGLFGSRNAMVAGSVR